MNNALDFSVLDALAEKRPATSPQEPPKATTEYKDITHMENAPQPRVDVAEGISQRLVAEQREKVRQRDAAEKQMEVYRAHQDAIRRCGTLMSEITKGITAGTDPARLLLLACEVIGSMTGETTFYEMNRQNLIAIRGAGLLEPAPLQMELDDVKRRLAMLTRPELDSEPEESRHRIQAAVKAHEARAERLEEQLGRKTAAGADLPTENDAE